MLLNLTMTSHCTISYNVTPKIVPIVLNSFWYLLFSKLCQHNLQRPTSQPSLARSLLWCFMFCIISACWNLGEESDAYSYPTVTSGGEGLPVQEEIECIGNVSYGTTTTKVQ